MQRLLSPGPVLAAGALLALTLGTVVSCSQRSPAPALVSADDPADPFLAAFRAGRYADALALVDGELAARPRDGAALAYRGACCAKLGRYAQAVDAFRRGAEYAPGAFADKTELYLRALSLCEVKSFARAQQVLDALTRNFPHSRLAERGQELAMRIESRLARGLTPGNLNWYVHQGERAHAAAQPGLAIEYLEEYFLLAGRAKARDVRRDRRARLSLGAAYLELAAGARALAHLKAVPLAYQDYRSGLFLALAWRAVGEHERARQSLAIVIQKTTSEDVRTRARRYLLGSGK